jgi:inhibitor of KinA sporulation pathway (predicted exonuclease)
MCGVSLLNVVDVEATCWEGEPPPGEVHEIIEIGICVLDTENWQRLGKHSIIVRPARSRVSAFCTSLTSLTQEEVAQGVTFAEACEQLKAEFDSGSRPWASWGDYDRNQFERQCARDGVAYPFSDSHANVRVRFTKALGLARRPGMDAALKMAGLPLEGVHHRGGDDAWNIAALAIELARRGQPVTSP